MKEQPKEENNLKTDQPENNAETGVSTSEEDQDMEHKPVAEKAEHSVEETMNIPEQENSNSPETEAMIIAETQTPEAEDLTQEKIAEAAGENNEDTAETTDAHEVNTVVAGEGEKELEVSEGKNYEAASDSETESWDEKQEKDTIEEKVPVAEDTHSPEATSPEEKITEKEEVSEVAAETNSDEDDDDNAHDEERDEEMEELESSEHYTDLDPDELITRMEALTAEPDPEPVRKKFFALRKAYFDIQKQERDQAYQSFINEGGAQEDYQMPVATPRDEKMRETTQKFKHKLTEKRERREKEKQENLAAKRQIIEDLKTVIQNEADILHAFDAIHELQAKWRTIGIVPLDQAEDLWQSYRFYVGKFYDLIRIHKELQELDQKKNLEAKIALCGQAEDLLLENSINRAITQLRELQDKWRDTGPVPRENNEEIWDRFKAAADKIYDRRRSHIESLRGEQEANLVKKTELCERAEKLVEQRPEKPGEWQKLTDELRQMQQEWRQIGPAPKQQNESIWKRFRAAGDKHFNDKKDYFSTLKREQDINKQKKTDICVQAESLKDSTEWKETADALKNLQEEWKTIGPVHPKYSQKLWERFRTACDAFFSQRSQHHSELDKEYTQNLELKTALVEEIEKFEPTDSKTQDLEKLKATQKQWSEIGRVPLKVKDKIYQRYRRALDKCYEKLNLSYSDRRNITSNNRIQQLEKEGRQLTPKDKSSVRYKIDKLQDEIRLLENNIGFFSNSKGASKLKEDYEKKIEKAKVEVINLKALLTKS